jgi:hypothetical protein
VCNYDLSELMRKLIKKVLAPIVRELIKEDDELKKTIARQNQEALDLRMDEILKKIV